MKFKVVVDMEIDGRDGQTFEGTDVNHAEFFDIFFDSTGFEVCSLEEAQAMAQEAFLGPDDFGMSLEWHVEAVED